jgi:isocitrate dehydrogenase
MAEFVLKNPYFMIGSTEISEYVREISVELTKSQHESTASGDGAGDFLMGLQNNKVTVKLKQDYASGKVDALLYAMWNGEAATAVKVRVENTTIAATNPEYQMSAKLPVYTPINGAIDSLAEVSVDLICTTVLTLATSA